MYQLSDYAYDLPPEKIAQRPCAERSDSRLMRIQRRTGEMTHHRFRDLVRILRPDDLLVINNTRVIPARLKGKKATGGAVEVLIIDYAAGLRHLEADGHFQCDCLVKASRQPEQGARLFFKDLMTAEVTAVKNNIREIRFFCDGYFPEVLSRLGEIPLPPYIRRDDQSLADGDRQAYQTVYARQEGAVAAPTAGLHFTPDLMAALEKKGIEFVPLTLHVGYGTFVPVKIEDIRRHAIHSEFFHLPGPSAERINEARKMGRRIVAVGTTSVRVLEFMSDETGRIRPGSGMCDLFIYPGYTFRCVDAVITNFHLPRSTLLMLVSAFYDREKMLAVYARAVENDYRFFSYGDAMIIE